MTIPGKTVVFWGAGATKGAGFRTTAEQATALAALTPNGERPRSRADRVQTALGEGTSAHWIQAVSDLLAVIGDADAEGIHCRHPTDIDDDQLDAMRRNWHSPDDRDLRRRIVELRTLYDWPALVAAIDICPKDDAPNPGFDLGAQLRQPQVTDLGAAARRSPAAESGVLRLPDLFNVLDLHQQSGHGFPVPDGYFLTPQRVLGARMALRLLLHTLMYVDWHTARHQNGAEISHHYHFAAALARRMQRQGVHLASKLGAADLETKEFVVGETGFVSMNWDPLGLWAQFVANRDLNWAASVPLVGTPARKLWTFHDLGHFVAGPRVDKKHQGSKVWEPMNESSARQLNDPAHGAKVRIRVSKYLFPHGSLWWRECPNCGQLSSFMGDKWEMNTETLLPPPPLRAFVEGINFDSWRPSLEHPSWKRGEVDARACVHCETLTFAHHMPLITQTNLKTTPPPFLEDIQRDMRVLVQKADHIVLMGYSLPSDDVVYRAFLAARTSRGRNLARTGHERGRVGSKGRDREPVRCSVVTWCPRLGSDWIHPKAGVHETDLPGVVASAKSLFGPENVRFHAGGFPAVLFDGGDTVTDAAVERLLNWSPA